MHTILLQYAPVSSVVVRGSIIKRYGVEGYIMSLTASTFKGTALPTQRSTTAPAGISWVQSKAFGTAY